MTLIEGQIERGLAPLRCAVERPPVLWRKYRWARAVTLLVAYWWFGYEAGRGIAFVLER